MLRRAVLYLLLLDTVCASTMTEGLGSTLASSTLTEKPDYLIVGAGGAGIQMALFLEKFGHSYAILEKEHHVGDFWTKFPRFEELISVNKSVRNETQRYRYDWHSFLEWDLGMLDVTEDYFPSGRDWHKYMSLVAETAKIHIQFGVEVMRLAFDTPCVHIANGDKICASRRVFVATGLIEKREPILEAFGGIPYSQATRARGKNRRVCILGNGNSGFEIAQNMVPVAERVTLYGKEPHRLSAVTRYTGDVRVKYLQAVENLNAKLLDTVDYFAGKLPRIRGLEHSPLAHAQIEYTKEMVRYAGWLKQFECEAFFYATGFRSHVPGMVLGEGAQGKNTNTRFPATKDWYAWEENPAIHFIGWLMHEQDFRRGAGGFFSGYRYLIRNLVNYIREADFGITYPHRILTKEEVARLVVERVQLADDLIILQDGVVLRDAVIPIKGDELGVSSGDIGKYFYYESISFSFHSEIKDRTDVIYVYFRWGNGRTVGHVFDTNYRYNDTGTLINAFLHPVIEIGKDETKVRDVHEDLDMAWNDPAYVHAIDIAIREALDLRTDKYGPKWQLPYERYKRITFNETKKGMYETANLTAVIDPASFQALWKAIYREGESRELRALKEAFAQWMPALFEHEEAASAVGEQKAAGECSVLSV